MTLLSIYFQSKQQRADRQIQANQGNIQHLKVRYFVSSSLCMAQKSMCPYSLGLNCKSRQKQAKVKAGKSRQKQTKADKTQKQPKMNPILNFHK